MDGLRPGPARTGAGRTTRVSPYINNREGDAKLPLQAVSTAHTRIYVGFDTRAHITPHEVFFSGAAAFALLEQAL